DAPLVLVCSDELSVPDPSEAWVGTIGTMGTDERGARTGWLGGGPPVLGGGSRGVRSVRRCLRRPSGQRCRSARWRRSVLRGRSCPSVRPARPCSLVWPARFFPLVLRG